MICKNLRWMAALTMAASLAITPSVTLAAPGANDGAKGNAAAAAAAAAPTTTPIKHVVVIFQENVSFDHYFATYPNAENPEGELKFKAKNATPAVDGLSQGLLEHNPNSIQPFRIPACLWTRKLCHLLGLRSKIRLQPQDRPPSRFLGRP